MSEQERKQSTVAEVLVRKRRCKICLRYPGRGKSGYDECTGEVGYPGGRGAA